MYANTIDQFTRLAATKAQLLKCNPFGFFIGAMNAGAYVGLGIMALVHESSYGSRSATSQFLSGPNREGFWHSKARHLIQDVAGGYRLRIL